MTKKMISWLSFMAVFLFLYSCRQELLHNEQENISQAKNITVQRLSHEELQLQHPDVMQKVENLISKRHSAKGIYTDAENGFSINTEVSVYIEDRYGNKTYTFEAITDRKEASVLKNIVLKDLGDGTFSVWMANYDQEMLSNREQTSSEFLKQHLTVDNLGDKKGSEIFSRASLCFTPVAMYEYIPAIPCTSPDHHTDPSQCDCGTPGHNCTPPTPSSYEFVYYIGTFDCGPGSSGNTTGSDGSTTGGNHGTAGSGGTTLPIGLGAGNGFDPSIFNLDPCDRTKDMLNRPNVQAGITTVKAQAKQTLTNPKTGEIGFKEKKDGTVVPADISAAHQVVFNNVTDGYGGYHNHTATGIHMVSPPDITDALFGFAAAQSISDGVGNAYLGMIAAETCSSCPDGVKYVHYLIRYAGTGAELANFVYSPAQMTQITNDYQTLASDLAEPILYGTTYINSSGDLNEKGLEKLFFDTLTNMGLDNKVVLQRIENNGAVYNVTKNSSGIITATPCP